MFRDPHHRPDDDARPGADAESSLRRACDRPASTPDLTDAIMSRLGYTRVDARRARWARRRRHAMRFLTVFALLGVIAVGVHLSGQRADARRPAETTVATALGNDVTRHVENTRSAAKLMSNLVRLRDLPTVAEPDAPDLTPSSDDR
ncbi:MAG: hypothetical protein KDA25_01890 [Phycisphaerales bacterium]|nr:hypothetical protein [Phycisphaerales bacterium]